MKNYLDALVSYVCAVIAVDTKRQRGATMIEYALIIAVVSIALVFAANTALSGSLSTLSGLVSGALGGTNPNAG